MVTRKNRLRYSSNEYLQSQFWNKNKKNMYIKVWYEGVYMTWNVFLMIPSSYLLHVYYKNYQFSAVLYRPTSDNINSGFLTDFVIAAPF